ncbi:auxin response factor 17 [Senna tora]|uniref:Auxin response factor n=1 Tax=Senna tora TaxID=362788 RepID=A0A834WH70_9FABA|nr:auxin response factor 17 [Senna tora]
MRPSKSRQVPPAPAQNCPLEPKIWRACAGTSVQIPALHSRVYYFPQGHLEHASSPPRYLNPVMYYKPLIPCRISGVEFLADSVSDEVFAKIRLHPLTDHDFPHVVNSAEEPDDDKIVSFAKILTPSDANNGGGFSVPRYCADSIFPPLDFQADPPTQTLFVTDVHGNVWDFRHIYRGTPRRHLLTTGWSKFVNHKKLVAGDSVVFMKNSRGQMFVGIRRAARFAAGSGGDCTMWCPQIGGVRTKPDGEEQEERSSGSRGREGFSRDGRGKLSPKEVADAAELAAQNMPFEVVYYPRMGWSDFVVKAEVVEKSWNVRWTSGMRVKMAMETEDSSRVTWFQGTVSSASAPDNGLWWGSPWRMLQVMWDEPEVLQNAKRVSPWEVELVSPTPPLHTAFPPAKRFRAAQFSGVPIDREGDPFSVTGLTNSTMGSNQLLSYNTFPAGMQGARHDLFSVSSSSNFGDDNSHRNNRNYFANMSEPKMITASTELNIDSSQSENLSLDSQSSLHLFGTDLVATQSCNSTKLGGDTIMLFGKVIQLEQPVESGSNAAGCTGDEGSDGCNETEGMDNPVIHSGWKAPGRQQADLNLRFRYLCRYLCSWTFQTKCGLDIQSRMPLNMNPLRYGQFHVGEDSDFQFVIERHLQICSEFGLMEFYVEISTHDINIDIENQLSSDYNTQPTPQTDQTLIASSSRLQIVGTCQPPTEDLGEFSDEDEYEASVPIRMSHQDKEDDNVWEDVVEEELANFYSQVDVERARGFIGDFGPRSDDVGELYEGMKFPTKAELRRHVKLYHIKNNCTFVVAKSGSNFED